MDLGHFVDQLIEHYRNLAVCKTFKSSSLTPELAIRYNESAALYTQPQCLSILDLLLKAQTQSGRSTSPKIALEMTLLQILRTKNRLPIEVLIRRLSDLETSLKEGPSAPRQEEQAPIFRAPEPRIEAPAPIEVAPEPQVSAPIEPLIEEPEIQIEETEPAAAMQEMPEIPVMEMPSVPQISAPEERSGASIFKAPELRKEEPAIQTAVALEEPAAPKVILEKIIDKIFEDTQAQDQIPDQAPIDQTPLFQPDLLDRPAPTPEPAMPQASATKAEAQPIAAPLANKHPSHYHTLMRFTAVELEGTFKN